jgi:hypothetical protein
MKKMPCRVLFFIFIGLYFILWPKVSQGGIEEAIYLSDVPPEGHNLGHGSSQRHGGDHSEHRASPFRKVYLNTHELSDDAEAIVLRPDGTFKKVPLSHDEEGWSVKIDMRPMDGSLDGIFNLYVIDKGLRDGRLLIRIAKANIINHSCGWGHKFKFDKERLRPKSLDTIPLEIVGYDMWDRNFHRKTASGERFRFSVLRNGRPLKAHVKIRTGSGWVKTLTTEEDGTGSFQLIRDYYPERWSDFNARNTSSFILTAEYEADEEGIYKGRVYKKIRIITTLPWKYQTGRIEYTSYAYGLLMFTLFSLLAGLVVFIYRQRHKGRWVL